MTILQAKFARRFPSGPEFRGDFNLCLRSYTSTVLFGLSGSGKSTILRCLAGLDTPTSGKILFRDETWYEHDQGINVSPQRRRIGYVSQDYALFPHLTVFDNISFGLRSLNPRERATRIEDLLRRFELHALSSKLPSALSGGQRQRVALARAVANYPRLLLLDEPLSAIDTPSRIQIRRTLSEMLSELKIPTIIVTHDRSEAITLGSQIVIMENGQSHQQPDEPAIVFTRPLTPSQASLLGIDTMIEGRVEKVNDSFVYVDVSSESYQQTILVGRRPHVNYSTNQRLYICIHASNVVLDKPLVSIAGSSPIEISAQNQIEGNVETVQKEESLCRITIDCHFNTIVAVITLAAQDKLNLSRGTPVRALIKATAIHVIPINDRIEAIP